MSTLLGIFAKHWTPGRVKTRLAAAIGPARAAELHRLFVETLLARFGHSADERVLAIDPLAAEAEFRAAGGGAWPVRRQGNGDLGERMAAFFAWGLARAERVVLIGSDSPDLPVALVDEAFETLKRTDVVLGPAADGGYYLVGAAGSVPPIFSGITWSASSVWSQTTHCLIQAGCRWQALGQWYDVDAADDLRRLRMNLLAPADARLAALAENVNSLLGDLPH